MDLDAALETLSGYERELSEIIARFVRTRDGIHISRADDPRWRQIAIELQDCLDDIFGSPNRYSRSVAAEFADGVRNFTQSPSFKSVENVKSVLSAAITRVRRDPRALEEPHRADLHPWSVVCGVLFQQSAADVVDIISLAGMTVDWSLTAREDYSNSTRKRTYRPRVDTAFAHLADDNRLRVTWVIAGELVRRDEALREELARRLPPIGWAISSTGIAPIIQDVSEMFFPSGKPHDAYVEIRKILRSASKSIAVIDPYLDGSILPPLADTPSRPLEVTLLTSRVPSDFAQEIERFAAQYPDITIEARGSREFHDRFVVIDEIRCFHVGASLKDAGSRAFMISRVEDRQNASALIERLAQAWDEASRL